MCRLRQEPALQPENVDPGPPHGTRGKTRHAIARCGGAGAEEEGRGRLLAEVLDLHCANRGGDALYRGRRPAAGRRRGFRGWRGCGSPLRKSPEVSINSSFNFTWYRRHGPESQGIVQSNDQHIHGHHDRVPREGHFRSLDRRSVIKRAAGGEESTHVDLVPIDLHFGYGNADLLGKDQDLHVEYPAFDVHARENELRGCSGEQLEAALSVLDVPDPDNVDVEVEAPHQEVAQCRTLSQDGVKARGRRQTRASAP